MQKHTVEAEKRRCGDAEKRRMRCWAHARSERKEKKISIDTSSLKCVISIAIVSAVANRAERKSIGRSRMKSSRMKSGLLSPQRRGCAIAATEVSMRKTQLETHTACKRCHIAVWSISRRAVVGGRRCIDGIARCGVTTNEWRNRGIEASRH